MGLASNLPEDHPVKKFYKHLKPADASVLKDATGYSGKYTPRSILSHPSESASAGDRSDFHSGMSHYHFEKFMQNKIKGREGAAEAHKHAATYHHMKSAKNFLEHHGID